MKVRIPRNDSLYHIVKFSAGGSKPENAKNYSNAPNQCHKPVKVFDNIFKPKQMSTFDTKMLFLKLLSLREHTTV